MDYTYLLLIIVTIVSMAVAALPTITGYWSANADRKAEEANQRRQHEITMRQSEVEQSLINTAFNYDFARDSIRGCESTGNTDDSERSELIREIMLDRLKAKADGS
jgi:hypothetical protein